MALHRVEPLPESMALRVARRDARTRSDSRGDTHVAGAIGEPSRQTSIAPDASAHPLVEMSSLPSLQPSQADELGRFKGVWDVLKRPKRP